MALAPQLVLDRSKQLRVAAGEVFGEETGELDKMLVKVADTYENEVDTLVGALMSLLEPLLIIGMGVTVGFIVIALFMPLIAIMERINK